MSRERQKLGDRAERRGFWRYLPLGLVLAALAAFLATGFHRSLSFETFVQHQARLQELVAAHRLPMVGFYMLVYAVVVTLSLPVSALLTTIGGYLFGWLLGGAVAAVSATAGATGLFLIARTSLGEPLLRRAGGRIQSLAAGFQRQAFSYLLFLRLMPIMPFWLTNLAAAFFGIPLRTFVLATQIGMLPASFAFAVAGSGLDDLIASSEAIRAQCLADGRTDCTVDFDARSLLTPEIMVALGILGILALAPILVRRWQARRQRGQV